MKPSGIFLAIIIASLLTATGCVTNAEFEEYKNQVESRFDNARVYDEALSCESRLDTYQELTQSDEPIPTRRDEPIGTRRDECETDFNTIFGPLVAACRSTMNACVADGGMSNEECRKCYNDCFSLGSWPATPECTFP